MPAHRSTRTYRTGLEVVTDTPRFNQYPTSPSSPSATLYSPTSSYSPTTVYSSSPPVSPTSSSHYKRRKPSTTTTEQLEPRPKKGDDNYVKRPENAFILFRRKCCEDRQAAFEASAVPVKKQRQADLSKTISAQWKALSASERAMWETMAKERKKEHELLHPGYVYRPQRKGRRASVSSGSEEEVVVVQSFAGRPRSSSNVEASSLMPMIEAGSFDFVPELVPSFGQHSFWQSPPQYPTAHDVFTQEQHTLLPAHEISPHSQTPLHFATEYTSNVDTYENYNAWDEAALAMWPQEQGDLFDFDLGSIPPVQVGGYAYAPEHAHYEHQSYAPYEFYPQQELATGFAQ